MPNIVIRHINGTKANQVEEVPSQGFRELLIGREANAHIRFDVDREDLVSRNHARIVLDPSDPNGYLLMDLDSRNGTFLNRQRIYGAARLQHGDRVQLGPAGPEFAFELDPAPVARPTRLAEASTVPPTREAMVGSAHGGSSATAAAVAPGFPDARPDAHRAVGKATVERMLGDVTSQMKGESRKSMWTALAGILVILLAGGTYLLVDNQRKQQAALREQEIRNNLVALQNKEEQIRMDLQKATHSGNAAETKRLNTELADARKQADDAQKELAKLKPNPGNGTSGGGNDGKGDNPLGGAAGPLAGGMSPESIHDRYAKSVVLIETTWQIRDVQNGAQLFIYRMREDGICKNLEISPDDYLPLIAQTTNDRGEMVLEPVLSTLSNDGHNAPVVASIAGSGFIVGGEGFFLTNRHVLAPWRSTWNPYEFTRKGTDGRAVPPYGIKVKDNRLQGCIPESQFPSNWVPSEGSKLVIDAKEGDSLRVSDRLTASTLRKKIQGDAVYNVTFAKTMQRYRATSVTISEKHDIALGKVDVPGGGTRVEVFIDQSMIRPGQQVVVMGYPAISEMRFGVDVSRDMFTNRPHLDTIADPTLTTGPISKVITSGDTVPGVDGVISTGDLYQLGINTTGAGNSGGPVFDSKGRVIAVFYAGSTMGGTSVTYAVPIKYGEELMNLPTSK